MLSKTERSRITKRIEKAIRRMGRLSLLKNKTPAQDKALAAAIMQHNRLTLLLEDDAVVVAINNIELA